MNSDTLFRGNVWLWFYLTQNWIGQNGPVPTFLVSAWLHNYLVLCQKIGQLYVQTLGMIDDHLNLSIK